MTMPMFPTSANRPRSPIQIANHIYGPAFDVASTEDAAAAMRDFKQLPETDQRYIHCHISYLNLQAQQTTHVLLSRLLEVLSANTGAVHAMADAILSAPHAEAAPTGPEGFDSYPPLPFGQGGPGGMAMPASQPDPMDPALIEAVRMGLPSMPEASAGAASSPEQARKPRSRAATPTSSTPEG